MKIWITRDNAFSILCGGMNRLHVWFRKPEYMLILMEEKDRDMPFGDLLESEVPYYRVGGWRSDNNTHSHSIRYNFLFGYPSDCEEGSNEQVLGDYVWDKLAEHFLHQPFRDWEDVEKAGKAKIKDFLLEVDLDIKLIK